MAEHVRPATAVGAVAGAEGLGGGTGLSATRDAEAAPFISQVPGTPVHFPTYHGRSVSWVAVSLILAGFVVGGFALIFGPTWWLFWVSCGISVIGVLLAMATGIFDDWY